MEGEAVARPSNRGRELVLRRAARLVETTGAQQDLRRIINEAYGLMPDEVKLLWETAPPRPACRTHP